MRPIRLLKQITKRKLRNILGKPLWHEQPESIMLDTHNYCNLSCTYCNVKEGAKFNLPRGKMSFEIAKTVLKYFGKNYTMFTIAPFMNGDPLLDTRLPKLLDMIQEITGITSVIDTNGVAYENREMLLHPNLWKVRFTISAATPKTYNIVHGRPYFDKATKTLQWFLDHKRNNQKAWLHFVSTKDNIHELPQWIERFSGIGRTVFTVHRGILKKSSDMVGLDEFPNFLDNSLPNEPFIIDENNKFQRVKPWRNKNYPCQCWGILSIGWHGEIMQCCDFPYKYNYGRVGEVDLLEAWKQRNENAMDNPCCKSCSLRFPWYKKVLDKWVN